MRLMEAITYLLGQACAGFFGYSLGCEYGSAVGWVAFSVMALLVDIRTRIKPYWID